jgi:hypothetical protein
MDLRSIPGIGGLTRPDTACAGGGRRATHAKPHLADGRKISLLGMAAFTRSLRITVQERFPALLFFPFP